MSDCIEWPHARFSQGYGAVYRDGKTKKAHRIAWEDAYGPIPEGMFVCHRCDNPPCVNIEHLFLGTPRDNVLDMVNKGRAWSPPKAKSVCKNGHEMDEANTRVRDFVSWNGKTYQKRICRACAREAQRAHRERMSLTKKRGK